MDNIMNDQIGLLQVCKPRSKAKNVKSRIYKRGNKNKVGVNNNVSSSTSIPNPSEIKEKSKTDNCHNKFETTTIHEKRQIKKANTGVRARAKSTSKVLPTKIKSPVFNTTEKNQTLEKSQEKVEVNSFPMTKNIFATTELEQNACRKCHKTFETKTSLRQHRASSCAPTFAKLLKVAKKGNKRKIIIQDAEMELPSTTTEIMETSTTTSNEVEDKTVTKKSKIGMDTLVGFTNENESTPVNHKSSKPPRPGKNLRTYVCSDPDCELIFHKLTELRQHERKQHADESAQRHRCGVCDRVYQSAAHLIRHEEIHSKTKHEDEGRLTSESESVSNEKSKRFSCKICKTPTSFLYQSGLVAHLERHLRGPIG